MKKISLLLAFVSAALAGFTQLAPVSVDLGFSDAHLEDLSGNAINANAIAFNQVVKIKVNVHNFSETDDAPAGHFRIKIGLGAGTVINPGFDLSTAPLSGYFTWTYDNSQSQLQIIGTSIQTLPADFYGTAVFEIKGVTPVTSTVSYNLLISNPPDTQTPLSDPDGSNNVAANEYTIAQQLSFDKAAQNVACYGAANGSIVITPVGGIPAYSVTLSNSTLGYSITQSSATAITFSNLAPATYTITVQDSYGSSATGTAIITQPSAALVVSAVSQSAILCNGGRATVTIAANGGTPPLYYTFNGQTNQTGIFANLSAGTYSYSVTDANSCGPIASNFTVVEPQAIVVTNVSQTVIACNGGSATVTFTAAGGTGTLSYTFNGETNTSGEFAGVTAGTYNYSVKDENNCGPVTGTFTVVQPQAVSVTNVSQSTILCHGRKATVTITAVGGTGALSYTFNGVTQTSNVFANLDAGTYNYSITDANGCAPATGYFTVTEPPAIVVSNVSQTAINCNGGKASVNISAVGGTGPLLYSFNGVTQSSSVFSNILPGTYNYSVTDGNNCDAATGSFTVVEPPAVVVNSVSQTVIACSGGAATVTLMASGGTGALAYTFNGVTNGSGQFLNIAAGNYTYSVTDANGCGPVTGSFTVVQPTALNFSSVTKTNNLCHNGNKGSITVAATGGTPSYSYTIAGPTVNTTGQTTGAFTDLSSGTYTVTVTDAHGCTKTTGNITINEPAGINPDVTVSVADYTDNFFPTPTAQNTNPEIILIYQVTEVGGNPAIKDTLRITKQTGYAYTLMTGVSNVTVNGLTYPLDNSRWEVDNTTPGGLFRIPIRSGNQLDCSQSVYIAVKMTRTSNNKSVFPLTSGIRSGGGEANLTNNTTTVVIVGQ